MISPFYVVIGALQGSRDNTIPRVRRSRRELNMVGFGASIISRYLFDNDVFFTAEFTEFGEKRFVKSTACADALFLFFAVDDHTPQAGEHGEQETDVLKQGIPLGREFDPESFIRGQDTGVRGQGKRRGGNLP